VFEVVLRGLAMRKTRAVLTACAVVIGVAMISGSLVLMDTVMSAYSSIFQTAYVHTNAVVIAQAPFGAIGTSKPSVPASLLTGIRALPEVARAHGIIDTHAQLTSATGIPIGKSSQEASLFGIPTNELDSMIPFTLVRGSWPRGGGQLIVDQATANKNHLHVGETVGLVARKPLERFRVVGIFRFAGAANMGPVQFVAVDLPVAQRIFDKQGQVDEIDVAARSGTSEAALLAAIRRIAPATAKVSTAAAQAQTGTSDVGSQFAPLRYVLYGIGGVALFVGAFIIFNTLSITVAQRTRELASLRVLGASRRQLLGSILIEGGLVGALGALVGLGIGLVFAKGLQALFNGMGLQLPTASAVLSWHTVAISLGAGLGVTLAASLVPARRAMRIAPILAIREGAAQAQVRRTRFSTATVVPLAVGVAALVPALLLGGLPTVTRLLLLAAGALVLFVGVAVASRAAVPALAGVIERPIERFTGGVGALAREDIARSPARTATTAAALTVGVALIAFVAVTAQGLRQSTGSAIRQQVSADYVITPLHDVLAPEVQQALRAGGVSSAGVRAGTAHVLGANETLTGVVPAEIGRFWHFSWTDRSTKASLTALAGNGVLLASDFAAANHLEPGATLAVETTSGSTLHLVVRGIYKTSKLAPLLGAMTITTALFDRSFTTPGDREIYLETTNLNGVRHLLRPFTTVQLHTLAGFITTQEATIATLLNLLYVLLALCVLISLFGIVNTLALSISERVREIGILRAIGMSTTQLRRMIRIESEVIALIGAVIGIAVGLILAMLAAQALSAWSIPFTIPWTTLGVLLLAAVLVGTVAAIAPARRAARLDPLTALSYE
jgi:putative ABC transport system permease protein